MSSVRLVSYTQIDEDFINTLMADIYGNPDIPIEDQNAVADSLYRAEGLMAYVARVSSPKQENPKFAGLLKYCIKHHHWSVFEMCDMTLEIQTSRAIAQQILRHRSFSFQEFSQRYAAVAKDAVEIYEARRQDQKNRQNSIDDMSDQDKEFFEMAQRSIWNESSKLYEEALSRGIAKECARFLLPLNTKTKLYMKGSVRSWIHYIDLRSAHGTQKEHMEIAVKAKEIFCKKFPVIAEALEWKNA